MIRRSLRYVNELPEAIQRQFALAYHAKDLLAFGLRSRLREGYSIKDFRADLLAALVVGVVALPLSMALAIACDVKPQHGLYTAIIAGFVCAVLGGTRFQVTGPTAAFVVILVPIVHRFGLGGLLLAGGMAGVILIAMGLARLGKLMQFVPHPVTTGFTMGIAIVIGMLQLKDVFGVTLPRSEGTFEYLGALWSARGQINPYDTGIAAVTIGLLLGLPRVLKRVPAPLVALTIVALLVVVCQHLWPGFHASTIGNLEKFTVKIGNETIHGIPPLPPIPMVPWHLPGVTLDYHTIRELLPSAFAIAMLGAIESLMAAVIADGMSGSNHDPNAELIALGVGNILCPFFGGIAATGALARTATNIRAGARSPFAAAMHAIFILACTIVLAPLVAYLPMAGLAGLLIIVARNMSEARHFTRLLRIAPRSDVVVAVTCFTLTVVFDMVVAVTVGVVLAALLFMRRMAVSTTVALETAQHAGLAVELPPGIRLYEVAGPMFFGAAKSAMEAIATVGSGSDHTFVLNMQHVPTIDVTALVALESVLDRLYRSRIKVIFAGLTPEVADLLDRAGIKRQPGRLAYAPDVETAVSMAIVHGARLPRTADEPP
ncbi:MAG TPA: SulP family inorganic anion transporter, partial [Kofleriaceae bacterium]|nr:SulP family inorganic anion transporter [Kofleriaceae bacterium]